MDSEKDILFYENFLNKKDADNIFKWLSENLHLTNQLNNKEGEKVIIPRSMAFYADQAIPYPYANLILQGHSWQDFTFLKGLKNIVENYTNACFNSVICNYYKDGMDTIGWHSDKEEQLGENPVIASLNIGAERYFKFKSIENKNYKFDYLLNHGSLLIMQNECQSKYLHSIRRDSSIKKPRLNLTFRYYHGLF